jgi:hypothetical protein
VRPNAAGVFPLADRHRDNDELQAGYGVHATNEQIVQRGISKILVLDEDIFCGRSDRVGHRLVDRVLTIRRKHRRCELRFNAARNCRRRHPEFERRASLMMCHAIGPRAIPSHLENVFDVAHDRSRQPRRVVLPRAHSALRLIQQDRHTIRTAFRERHPPNLKRTMTRRVPVGVAKVLTADERHARVNSDRLLMM